VTSKTTQPPANQVHGESRCKGGQKDTRSRKDDVSVYKPMWEQSRGKQARRHTHARQLDRGCCRAVHLVTLNQPAQGLRAESE